MSTRARPRLCLCLSAIALFGVSPTLAAASGHRGRRSHRTHPAAHSHRRPGAHHRGKRARHLAVQMAHRRSSSSPTITAASASSVTATSATFNGSVNPDGASTSIYFQYGTSVSYGSTTNTQSAGSGSSSVAVTTTVQNLKPGTTYHYRIVATNWHGTSYGGDTAVATKRAPTSPPTVSTGSSSAVTSLTATLGGTVNPNGSSTSFYYQFGPTSAYGQSTSTQDAGSGTAAVAEPVSVGGLQASSTYHFRLVASNGGGTAYGADQAFETAAAASSYDQAVLADHPAAFWGMNGQGLESDLTGHGHTGTYVGRMPAEVSLPNGDRAQDFNTTGGHSGQYLTVPSSSAFSIPTAHELTFEAWIRPDVLQFANASSSAYVDWMGKCQNYSPSCEWEARMYSQITPEGRPDRLSAYAFNPSAGKGSAADWQPASGVITAGKWLYVVGEYQTQTTPSACSTAYPGTISIWVNGIQQNFAAHAPTGCMSQYPIIPTAGSSPLDIGTMALDTWFQGAIGKVAIYNTLLSQPQITTHYEAMTGLAPSGGCADTCTIP